MTQERGGNHPKIEYNIGGALLKTLSPESMKVLVRRLEASGVELISMVPVRGLPNVQTIRDFFVACKELKIFPAHLERAWNPPNSKDLWPALKETFIFGPWGRLTTGKELPVLWDGLSPNVKDSQDIFSLMRQEFPGVKVISHSVKEAEVEDRLIETSRPLLEKGRDELIEYAMEHNLYFVFDYSHLEDLGPRKTLSYANQPVIGDPRTWEDQWNAFSSSKRVRIVDFRPPSSMTELVKILFGLSNYGGILKGEGIMLELASAASEVSSVKSFRVEAVLPPFEILTGSLDEHIETLSRIIENIRESFRA